MKPHLDMKIQWAPAGSLDSRIAIERSKIELLWELVKPVKFPARRRREDREVPKAA